MSIYSHTAQNMCCNTIAMSPVLEVNVHVDFWNRVSCAWKELCSNFSFNFFSDDDNRIILKPIGDLSDCQHDYINASYIDVSTMLRTRFSHYDDLL